MKTSSQNWKSVLSKFGVIILLCLPALSQVPVSLMPIPQPQFFDANGVPLAFGCVFTYRSQTTTPLATYTDFTGTILNSNPIPLNASGSAGIWLQSGQAYTIQVKSAGGDTNCSLGTQTESVDGIGGGLAQAVTPVPSSPTPSFVVTSQIQIFTLTLTADTVALPVSFVNVSAPVLITFQITQDGAGGHAYTCPSNVTGCASISATANVTTTQTFVWNGTTILPVGSAYTSAGDTSLSGSVFSGNTYSGANTFTGANAFSGNITSSGTNSFTGANTFSNAANAFKGANFTSGTASPAASGIVRLAKGDSACWNNNAGSSDVCITKDTSDNFQMPNSLGLGGTLTKLNTTTTVGLGVAGIYGTQHLTGNTANISPATLITTPFGALWRVSCFVIITTADGASSTLPKCTIGWTSQSNNTVEAADATATSGGNALTTFGQGSVVIDAKGATAITYTTSGYASGTPSTMTYAVFLRAEAI